MRGTDVEVELRGEIPIAQELPFQAEAGTAVAPARAVLFAVAEAIPVELLATDEAELLERVVGAPLISTA